MKMIMNNVKLFNINLKFLETKPKGYGERPINQTAWQLLKVTINNSQRIELIQQSISKQACPMVSVKKKDVALWGCVALLEDQTMLGLLGLIVTFCLE